MQHRFIALELALQAAEMSLPRLGQASRGYDDLLDQYRRAVVSVGLNLAESRGRTPREEARHFRVAYGSCQEAMAALRLIVGVRLIDREAAKAALGKLDSVAAITWRLLHRR